jgi:hypothetical protein
VDSLFEPMQDDALPNLSSRLSWDRDHVTALEQAIRRRGEN